MLFIRVNKADVLDGSVGIISRGTTQRLAVGSKAWLVAGPRELSVHASGKQWSAALCDSPLARLAPTPSSDDLPDGVLAHAVLFRKLAVVTFLLAYRSRQSGRLLS